MPRNRFRGYAAYGRLKGWSVAKGRGRTTPTAGEAPPTEEQQGQDTMASGDEHSLPTSDAIQAMSDEKRMALLERLLDGLSTARLESAGAKVQQVRQERIETERDAFIARIAPFIAEAKPLGIEL